MSILVLTLSSCGSIEMFIETEYKLNNLSIIKLSDDYKDSDSYKETSSSDCDEFVYVIDDIEYYYHLKECHRIYNEYMIKAPIQSMGQSFMQLMYLSEYLYTYYDEVTNEELEALDFISKRELEFINTGNVMGRDSFTKKPYNIYTHKDDYYINNEYCLQDFETILYEDNHYKYVYKYRSCDEEILNHFYMSIFWKQGIRYYNISSIFYGTQSWDEIEATGIGEKVAK